MSPPDEHPEDLARRSLIDATSESLMRIALAFGVLNAIVPLGMVIATGEAPPTIALAAAWLVPWLVAIARVDQFRALLTHRIWRWVLTTVAALATGATILATGGLDSPLSYGSNWLGWAATVVVTPLTAIGLATVLSAGTTGAYLIAAAAQQAPLTTDDRYAIAVGLINPPIIVLVALALAGVFKAVIASAPGTLWTLRHGGRATTPALTAVLGRPPATALLASAEPADGPELPIAELAEVEDGSVPLTDDERRIVDLLADGLVPKEVARALERSPDAIYARIAAAKRKVGASTIEHLVALTWQGAA